MKRGRPGDAALAEYHRLERGIVGEHAHHYLALRRVRRQIGAVRAGADEWIGLFRRAVPNRHIMTGLDEVGGHRAAHLAQADEPNLHACASLAGCRAVGMVGQSE